MKDLTNYNYRSEVMWAGTVAHNDTVGVGREQDWATHDLSYEISALYDLTHGSAVAIVLYSWMKYVYKHDIARFVRFAKYVMGINTDACTPEEAALAGIEKLLNLSVPSDFRSIFPRFRLTIPALRKWQIRLWRTENLSVSLFRL